MNKEELQNKIIETDSLKEKIKLEGKLITLIKKQIKSTKDISEKNILKLELINELKKHKETIKNIKSDKSDKLPISNSLAVTIKDIATTIDIFKEKHDVINKINKAGISTVISTVFAIGVTTAVTAVTGGVLTIPTLASVAPIATYIGLSNIIHMAFNKTNLEEYLKDAETNDEEVKKMREFNDSHIKNNHELVTLIKKSRETKSVEELTEIVEKIIELEKEIEDKTETNSCKYVMNAEIVAQMNLLQKCYKQQKKDFIKDKNNMTNKDFAKLEKKSLEIDGELLSRNNYIKETGKELVKQIGLNTAIMFGTKLCLSTIFPSFALSSLSDIATPAIISAINNITNINSIKDKIKIKEAKYCGKYIEVNSTLKEKLDNIITKKEVEAKC